MFKKLILFLTLSTAFFLYSEDIPDFHLAVSSGDIGVYFFEDERIITGSLGSIGVIESNTGLGLNLHIWTLSLVNSHKELYELFDSERFLGTELIWEPYYDQDSIWAWNLFYRVDHLVEPSLNDWRTGIRGQFQFPIQLMKPYPTIMLEAGYWNEKGFYAGIKFDTVVFSVVGAYAILESFKEKGEEHIPEGVQR